MIFYKAAFYDRRASTTSVAVVDANGTTVKDLGRANTENGYDEYFALQDEADKRLSETYPEHRDSLAYWD